MPIADECSDSKCAARSALCLALRVLWHLPFGRRRMAHEIRWRRFDHRGREPRLPVVDAARQFTLHIVHELVDFALHLLDLAAHVEDDFDPGEVDAEISRQREDRLELLEVFFRIQPRIAVGTRRLQQPFALVEAQRLRMDVVLLRHGADHVIRLPAFGTFGHHPRPMSLLIFPNSRSSSFDRSSRTLGSISRTSTTRSPRRPSRGEGIPRSRSRNRWPDCVPGGTRSRAVPSGVCTSTRAPSAASWMPIAATVCRSSPSRRNEGWDATCTVRYRSPGGPPRTPAFPLPCTRTRSPSPIPAGICT